MHFEQPKLFGNPLPKKKPTPQKTLLKKISLQERAKNKEKRKRKNPTCLLGFGLFF